MPHLTRLAASVSQGSVLPSPGSLASIPISRGVAWLTKEPVPVNRSILELFRAGKMPALPVAGSGGKKRKRYSGFAIVNGQSAVSIPKRRR
jgi:hypothetical protein